CAFHPPGREPSRTWISRWPQRLTAAHRSVARLELHLLLVNRQEHAARLADNAVPRSGRINHQSTRRCCAVLISLRSGKNKDMLVALVFVHGNTTLHTKPDEGRRRTGSSISVEPINIHAVAKRLPRNRVGILGNLKQIL